MIYISSACIKAYKIDESINSLYVDGFQNIELSGGTNLYDDLTPDLDKWKEQGVNFLLHNYFPPPPRPFVLNLASLDKEIEDLSLAHARKAIAISEKLGLSKYGIHAGFLINIPLKEIGKPIKKQPLFDRDQAMDLFVKNINQLQSETEVELYIENNVVAPFNLENFKGVNPFFLTSYKDYVDITSKTSVKMLVDIAHLKVSCHALKLNFEQELEAMLSVSDYIHVSDNDGTMDSNLGLKKDSTLYQVLKGQSLSNKIFTLEVYDGIDSVKESYNNLLSLI